jgi:hypothetical protein
MHWAIGVKGVAEHPVYGTLGALDMAGSSSTATTVAGRVGHGRYPGCIGNRLGRGFDQELEHDEPTAGRDLPQPAHSSSPAATGLRPSLGLKVVSSEARSAGVALRTTLTGNGRFTPGPRDSAHDLGRVTSPSPNRQADRNGLWTVCVERPHRRRRRVRKPPACGLRPNEMPYSIHQAEVQALSNCLPTGS